MTPRRDCRAIHVTSDDLYPLLVSAVRYALGRRTYIVVWICDMLRLYWPHIESRQRAVILRDIAEACARGQVGGECDDRDWQQVLAELRESGA